MSRDQFSREIKCHLCSIEIVTLVFSGVHFPYAVYILTCSLLELYVLLCYVFSLYVQYLILAYLCINAVFVLYLERDNICESESLIHLFEPEVITISQDQFATKSTQFFFLFAEKKSP